MAAPKGTTLPHVRAWRERRWLTQEKLANKAGVKVRTVQYAEHGGTVSARTIWALADALEVTPDQLCFEAPDKVAV